MKGVVLRALGLLRLSLSNIRHLISASLECSTPTEMWEDFLAAEVARYNRLSAILVERVGDETPGFIFLAIQQLKALESSAASHYGVSVGHRARSSQPWIPPGISSKTRMRLRRSDAVVSAAKCDGFLVKRESDRSIAVLRRCKSSRGRQRARGYTAP